MSTSSSTGIPPRRTPGPLAADRGTGSSTDRGSGSSWHGSYSAARRPMRNSDFPVSLAKDFERFKRELPRDFPAHVRDTYGINLSARYLGEPLPHPIGKGSGQLSLN